MLFFCTATKACTSHCRCTPFYHVTYLTHLLTVVVALLLPLPMLLSLWLLTSFTWTPSTPASKASWHTFPGEEQTCCSVSLFTAQALGCQSALIAAKACAMLYSKTVWEYAQISLRDEQIEHLNAANTALVKLPPPVLPK